MVNVEIIIDSIVVVVRGKAEVALVNANINVDVLIVPPVEVDVAKSAKVVAGYFDVSE